MGFYTCICGKFQCVKCGLVAPSTLQTKLFHVDATNSSCEYHVGSEVTIDGLEDFCELYPWDGSSILRIIMGDWDCRGCSLNWQWAKIVFNLVAGDPTKQPFRAVIREATTFLPDSEFAFHGINFVQDDLALFAITSDMARLTVVGKLDAIRRLPLDARISGIIAGHRQWLHDVVRRSADRP